MGAWGVRFDLTGSTNLDDPVHMRNWVAQVDALRKSPVVDRLLKAIQDLFGKQAFLKIYTPWFVKTLDLLEMTTGEEARLAVLQIRLDELADDMKALNPDREAAAAALIQANTVYREARDTAIRNAQTHKLSVEYTNRHPPKEPSRSTTRLIYSHQPGDSKRLITLNFAATFYNRRTLGADTRFRDLQFAAQLDRRLASIATIANPVLTFAAYYQWMKEDALLEIPATDLVPGTGIALPGGASSLLGTKGHIGIGQVKLSFPMGENVKVPLSVTWANRTQLIKERDLRAQIGFTLDLDSLFQR